MTRATIGLGRLIGLAAILALLSGCDGRRNSTSTPASPASASSSGISETPGRTEAASVPPALERKGIAKCAVEPNAVSRLACFDDFAKASDLAPKVVVTPSAGGGLWVMRTDTNPLTDKAIHFASLTASQGIGRFGEKISLTIRCKEGRTEAYINWNTFLGTDDISVTSRLDKQTASTHSWGISTDHKASFMPQPVALLKMFESGSSYVANLTPYGESPITAVFDITGAGQALKDIRNGCNW